MQFHLEGVFPALLTPFTRGGRQVDYERAVALADRLARQGVHGLFVCGTTGEGPLMTLDERKRLLEHVIAGVGKRIKVLAHTGCLDTASTIELTCHAAEAGAVLAGVIAPGFFGYDPAALFAHFRAVAKAVPRFPVFLYNLPVCARNVLTQPLVLRLASEVDNIVGIKDSSGDMVALSNLLVDAPKGFNIISGVDSYLYEALVAGANGCVASTANVLPELFLAIYNAVRQGDLKRAWKAQCTLSRACSIFGYGSLIAPYKEALRLRGFEAGCVRPPQREITAKEKGALKAGLGRLGVL